MAIRIIAGTLRGRRIPVPARDGLRPTPDRVREALFNILGYRIRDARVLDAFAGSGALGFEALSRGAGEVVFVEPDRPALRSIRETAENLDVSDRCRFVAGGVPGVLQGETPFDLILADPPYADDPGPFLEAAVRIPLLHKDGVLVVERRRRDRLQVPAALVAARIASYGSTSLHLLEWQAPGSSNSGGNGESCL